MIFLGLASIMQSLLLPGIVLYPVCEKVLDDDFKKWLFIIIASLTVTFYGTLLLIHLKIISNVLILTIMAGELAVIWVNRKKYQAVLKLPSIYFSQITNLLDIENGSDGTWNGFIRILLRVSVMLIAALSICYTAYLWYSSFSSVFNVWDAVVSYNRWAGQWAGLQYPTGACEYPQLLPVNWALSYILTSSKIPFFARMLQGAFPLLSVSLFVALGISLRSWGMLFFSPVFYCLLNVFSARFLFDGYMDTALTFGTFTTVSILCVDIYKNRYARKTILFSGIAAGFSALVKQPGLLVMVLWFAFNIYYSIRQTRSLRGVIVNLFLPTVVVAFIILPWYSYNMINLRLMNERSCLAITTEWAKRDLATFWDNTQYRLNLLNEYALMIPFTLIMTIVSKKNILRAINLGFTLPLALIVFFYGIKNEPFRYMMPAVPLFTMNLGLALEESVDFAQRLFRNSKYFQKSEHMVNLILFFRQRTIFKSILVFMILLIGVTTLWLKFPDDRLRKLYDMRQRKIGEEQVNTALYENFMGTFSEQSILSWYPYINYLPGFEGTVIDYYYQDVSSLEHMLEIYPTIKYLFYPANGINDDVYDYIHHKIESGEYEFISNLERYDLVRIP